MQKDLFGDSENDHMDLLNKKPIENKSYAHGGLYQTDERFHSWTNSIALNDIAKMIKLVHRPGHPIDTHFLYLNIVEFLYKQRNDPQMRILFKNMALEHILVFDLLIPVLYYKSGNNEDSMFLLPHVPTFQYLATVYAEDGEFGTAIEVCKRALGYGLEDGTRGGFIGRIERLKKKAMEGKFDLQNNIDLGHKDLNAKNLRENIEDSYCQIRNKSIDLAENLKYDCVEITSYPTSCSLCKPFQGSTFSISGSDPDFPPLSDAIASGLFHGKCHHLINVSSAALNRNIGKLGKKDSADDVAVSIEVEKKINVENKQNKGGFFKRFGL